MNNFFKGTGPAVITPFKKSDLSIDFDALTRVLNFQIESGVDFIVALGTTAETVTMSHDERHLVYQHIKGINKGKLPLMVGFGGNNTAEVIRHIKSADFNGIDGILSVVPYYNKPSQEGVYRHFMAIAEVCPVPVILYNVPSRCGINMTAETTLRLANSSDKFMAIKEASGNLEQINKIIADAPAGFGIISGDDSLIYDVCNNGGDGVISVMANALPAETVELTNLSLKKDANAKALQLKYSELIRLLFVEGNPCGVKSILGKKGLIDNVLRLPMCPVSEETSMKISAELSKL
ncbi:MAG: 4-hydroxy-tetrahydrodipicolinate synthase [Prolixibacteraceae bacterium]|nr:4-hydroxy-tetrahydrodipicolinate synthase [Prolixibacteraceae bacterium]